MKLTKNNLIKKLGVTDENIIKVVVEYNKLLPILSEDGEGFCVDARVLHGQLKIKDTYSRWIKNNLDLIDSIEGADYSHAFKCIANYSTEDIKIMSVNKRNSLGITEEYILTLDTAKEICMVIGALPRINEDTKKISKIARKYFIYVEKILKDALKWEKIREPEKEKYKEMCSELKLYFLRNFNKEPMWYDYANEADAINQFCLGSKSKQIKEYIEAQDNNTRDWLNAKYNEYLDKAQELNLMYLRMNFDKEKRYDLVKQGFKALYPNASFLIANI